MLPGVSLWNNCKTPYLGQPHWELLILAKSYRDHPGRSVRVGHFHQVNWRETQAKADDNQCVNGQLSLSHVLFIILSHKSLYRDMGVNCLNDKPQVYLARAPTSQSNIETK